MLDNESKVKAMEKANNIDVKMAYPEFIYNDTHLNTLYNYTLNVSNYLGNSLIINKSDFKDKFVNLRAKNDRKKWLIGPAIVNAFYSPTANQICFPAGILQTPFFDSKLPKYLNYGSIGCVIGHEITHGFDDQGRLYDKNGKLYSDTDEFNLWSNKTVYNFIQRTECIIDQYSKYNATQVNLKVNGYQTQGETIADNGVIKQSFGAYQKWATQNEPEQVLPGLEKYSQAQMFFINYAQVWCAKYSDAILKFRLLNDPHPPAEFRIKGPTSNFIEFSKAFNCKLKQSR